MAGATRASSATVADDRKGFHTLRARAALHGFACGSTAEGWIVLRRFDVSAVFDSLADAGAWLASREGGAS